MSKTSKTSKALARKAEIRKAPLRRTRMIALEPRMLFDGALGVDLGAKATAVVLGDASQADATTVTPATPEAAKDSSKTTVTVAQPASASATPAEKDALQKPGAEALDAASKPGEPKEIVFVDSRVKDYQGQLAGVDPKATIVFLNAGQDGVAQIAETMSKYSDVTAVHIVAQGGADQLLLGSGKLDAASMTGLNAQRISSISEHLASDAKILVHGADFGKGAGAAVADRLALLTSADVGDVDRDGNVEAVGTPARQEIVFVDPTVRDYQKLVDGIENPNARVVLLDSTRDGVQQIADVVKQYNRVDAIHIISHGSEGQIDLGSGALNSMTMAGNYAAQLAEIGKHLSGEADLLVYGCNFGKGVDGTAAAQRLADLTGADVAASVDDTGDAALGGNWQLERQTGVIETGVAVDRLTQDEWHQVMALHTLDFDSVAPWTVGNTSMTYTVDGYPVTISVSPAPNGTPALANNYTGGQTPAQDAMQFTLGATGSNTITIDFTGQPGGIVSNVGFALWDVDNAEQCVFSATLQNNTVISPTQLANSAYNAITAGTPGTGTSVTVTGTGTDSTALQANGNVFVYFNRNDIKSVSFTYTGTANTTLVVLNDITFMGNTLNPPMTDLDQASGATGTAADTFVGTNYTGSTGTIAWAGPWTETDSTGAAGSATAGQVQVIDTPAAGVNNAIRLNNSSASAFTGVQRAINLSAYSSLTMSWDYMTSTGLAAADQVVLEISTNGGANWTMLKSYSGSSSGAGTNTYTADSVSLAGYESANTVIRFRTSGTGAFTGAAEYFYVDNISIVAQDVSSSNTYTEGDAVGVRIAATANSLITDPDSTNMASVKVQINNVGAGDLLTWTNAGSITGTYTAATGILQLTGVDSKANYQSVINSIRYKNSGDDPTVGGTRTSFTIGVTATDSGFNEGNTALSTITVVSTNDAPVNTVPAAQTINEDTPLVFSSGNGNLVSIVDVDAPTVQVQLTVTNGTLTLSGTTGLTFNAGANGTSTMTITGTQANVNAALAGMSYASTANYNGGATLTVFTSDLGGSGSGGTLTDSDTVAITILPVDDTPTGTDTTIAATEDTAYTFTVGNFGYSDVEGQAITGVRIDTLPAAGSLTLSGVAVTAGQVISAANITAGNLKFTPAADANGTGYTTFTFSVQNATGTDTAPNTMTVDVSAVNDAPVNAVPVAQSTVVNAPITFSSPNGNPISISDVDGNTTVQVALSVGSGTLTLSGTTGLTLNAGANGSSAMTYTGTVANINAALAGMTYNAATTGTRTLTITTNDLGNTGTGGALSDTDTVSISVLSNNILDLDSTPSVVVTPSVVTSDLVSGGAMTGANGNTPAGWTEGGATAQGAISGNRYAWTANSSGAESATLNQNLTVPTNTNVTSYSSSGTQLFQTNTVTTNAITAITFDYVWANTDNTDNNRLSVYYGTTLLATFDTGVAGTTGNWTLAGGVTSPSTLTAIAAQGSIAGTLSSITLNISAPFTTNAALSFRFGDATTGVGGDDIAIDNVVATNTASVTTTVTTIDLTNTGWNTTYTENGAGVSIADTDSSVFNAGVANLTGATITLTNAQTSDRLLVGGSTGASGTVNGIAWTRAGNTITLNGSFTKAQYADAIEMITFDNTSDAPNTTQRVITVSVTDGTTTSNTAVTTIDVVAVNDAPVLDATKTPVLAAVNEDAGAPVGAVGTLVSSLVDFAAPVGQVDNVTDVDSGASLGIAITAANTASGTWYYSTNNGGSWNALGAVSAASARLLAADANTRVYFQPSADYNGTVTNAITFRAWDQSSGANGGTADTSVSGGTTAFSSATDTANITVNSVNDAPVNTVPAAQSVNEDTSLSISGISVNDVDGNISTTRLTVTNGVLNVSLAGGATISAGANNSSTLTLSGTQAQINTALASLSYQGNLNFNGSDTLAVLSTDASAATDSDTVAITVNSVNDAPVNTVPLAQSVSEDTSLSISGISVVDVDGNLSTTRLTVSNGTLNVSLVGGATISSGANGSSTLTLSGTQAQINAALASLSYQGNLNFNGSDTLTVLSTDSNAITDSDTVAITVNSVNDAPVNAVPGAQTVTEDTALSIAGISVNDVDGNLSTTRVTVTNGTLNVSLVGGATISAGANNSSTLTLSGTQAQINAALASLSYQGNLNFNGSDTLTVLSTDSNAITDSDTVAITVNAVNDAPVNTVPLAQSVNEDTSLSIAGISVNDVDGNLSTTRLTVTNGTLNVSLVGGATISAGANNSSTLTLSGTQAQINAALASVSYQGNLNFNGSDTLTVLSTDSNAITDSDTVAITVSSMNDVPVNTVPGAQSVNEDTALSISGISVNDVDGNLSTTRLTVTGGTLNVSLVGGATITSGANGTATLTLSGTQAQINAALATLSYQGNLNFNGSDTLTVLSTDANAATDSDTVAITVNSINDAPVNTVPLAQSVNEDTALSISGISVNDVDGNLSTTRLTVTNGRLTVSLAGGATISSGANNSSTLTLAGTQAQINAALASVSYQGNLNFNGSDTLTVLSTDSNAITDSDTVAITVNSMNDVPVNTVPGAQSVNEDTALSISGISVNDVDANLSTTRLTVTNGTLNVSLAGGATISSGANSSSTLTLSGTQAQINAALASLSYQGNLNFNGSDTLTVLSTDASAATDSDTVAITVTSVNDAPVNTVPGAQSVNEDTALSISGISVNDVDGNLSTTRLTVTGGTLNVSLVGGATITSGANGTATLTLSGTQAQINAALASLSYQGNLNFNGSDTLTVLSTDSNAITDSDAVAITVNSVNDAPVNTVPLAQSVNEDTALSIAGISVNDVDGNLSTTRLTVTNGALNVSLVGGATISAGANNSSTLTLSGTQAQINAALASLSYQGNLNFNGSDTLTVLSTDSNAITDSDTVAITVNSMNDVPVNTVPGAQSVNEDTALSISGISVNDVDGNLSTTRLTVSNGRLTVSLAGGATISAGANSSSTLTLSGTQAQINAALASLSYQGNLNFNGSDTLTVLSTDASAATDSDTVAITVNSVNDAPVNAVPGAQTVTEDTALSIAGISVNDVDGNLSTTRVTVTNGALNVSLVGGATISAGANNSSTLTLSGTQAQINAALASLSYQGNLNFNGSDTLTVLSTDSNAITDSDTVAITVNSVNDVPVNTVPGAQTIAEDSSLAIAGISVNDVDGNLSTTRLTVSSGVLNVSLVGGATISAGTNGSSTLTLSGTQAQINAALATLTYQGNLNFNGSDTLTVLSTDSNAVTDSDTVAITVSSVNDLPINTVPGAQTVNEDASLAISGISVNDVDGNLSTTRLTVTNGTLNVSLAGGATISSGANNSSTLTLSGTQTQINAALATLAYQGSLNFNGSDTLTVLSTDSSAATDTDTVAITVNPVNDAPVNTVPGAQTVNEDTSLSIGGLSVVDVDGNLSTTRLTVSNGTLNVSLAGGATISSGANNSSTLTLSGTQAQINAALASLSYQGNLNFNGSDTLTVLSTDSNAITDSDTVAITVNSVNDAPVNTVPGAQAVNEDTSLSIAGISVNDVDGNLSTTRLTVTNGALNVSLVGGATISSGANNSSTLTLSGTQAQINAALASLSYQGNLNFNGSDTLTVLSTDSNAITDSDTVAITVSSVNDVPVNTVPGPQTVNEDTSLSIAGISVNDVDGNLSTTRLTVTNGTLNVSLVGGATISSGANGTSTLTLSGTQAQINAALASLSYQGSLNFNGSDTLTVLSTDANGATDSDAVAITVSSVNDVPVNTVPGAQTVNEDTSLSIAGISVNDVDGNLSTTRVTVTNGALNVSLAGGATISSGANNSSTLTLSGTQAQINAALASLSYQGSLNFNGSDTLTVLSTDANGATDSDAVAITVSSVNDVPVNTVPGAQTVNEDTSLSIAGISVNDVDGNLSTTRLTVTNGALNVSLVGGATISSGANNSSTLTLSGTQAQINAALASLSYQGNLNFNGSDTLTVLSTDANGATDSDAVAITVSSVNDVPVNTVPGAQTVSEDTSLSIAGISVNDVDGNLSTTRVTVTNGALNVSLAGGATISSGANGSSTLTLSGTQAQINAALASISYQGSLNFNGSDTLTVLSTDANGATDSDTVAITVSSVNDVPVNTVPGAQAVNEDTALSIAGISVNDVDGNLSTSRVTVTNGALNVSLVGGATISSGANNSSTLTLSGTQAQINAALASLSYQGNLNFNGSDTLTVLSTDANGATDSDAVAITVSSVNDVPVNTVPGAQVVNEDTSLSIAGISVNDVDGNLSSTRLTVASGTLNVSLVGGATISSGANNSSTLTLSGTQAQINAALASLSYQGSLNFNGSDTLTVLSTDANGATDSDAVAITVSSVNDVPVNTVPGAQTVNEDTSLSIAGISVNDVDGNLSTTRVTVTNGTLNVSLAGGATISSGANSSSTLTLSGTQAQINAALASLSYQGSLNFNGSDTLTVLSTDSNGVTDSDAVSITVSAVNDVPVNTVPGAQTVNEDTALSIAGISVNDVDGNLSTTRLTVASGTLNVSLVGGATISSGANNSSTLTLSGTQAQINAALASLSYQGNLNFNGSDTLAVLSTDSNGATDSDTVAITVSSVNDVPVNTVPGAQTVNEDTTLSIAGISVNDVDGNLSTTRLTVASGTLNVSLAGGATISSGANSSSTVTLSGTQAQINAALASLSYRGNLNFNGSDTLTVLSTDANGATDSDTVAITVSAVNDAPSGANATVAILENSTYTFAATDFGFSDPDAGDTLTAVRIDTAPGAGTLILAGSGPVAAGQVISRADIDAGKLQYTPAFNGSGAGYSSVGFSVSDGSLFDVAPNTLTIDVGWVNHAPTITSGTAVAVGEGIATSTIIYTGTAIDLDLGDTITWSLSGADAAAFTVNTSTGEVTFNASPDYETKSSYSFNVVASDGTISSSQGVTVTVTDVAPSITSATSVSVPEGTATSTVVYTAAANDPAGGAVSFTLSGADAAAFTINAASGQVTFNASPDYETKSSYSFNVVASDGTLTSSQAVTVSVTDVAPAITSATSVSVPEGTATSTVVYTAAATDVQGGAVSFTLSGADAAAFTINAATGAVTFNASPDFETKSSYSFNVVASDGTLTSSQAVTVSVTDVAPTITSATTVSVAEGTATSTVIYTAAANDPAGGAVSFSLSGADAAAFTINAATGAVTFNASPDYETKSAYSFNVVASDGTISSSQAVTVSVTDVAPTITSSSSVSVAEGTATSTVIYTAAANDPAGGAVSFTLSGADAAAFTINAASGQVTFNASPDYETKSSYSFNVVASDGTISSSQAVTVSVTDVAPTITSATSVSVAEGTATSTVIYTAAATDVQGGAVSFTLSGADAAAFTVNAASGQVTFNSSPDYETKTSYTFNVVASDGTTSSSQAVTVSVTDVAPTVTSATAVSVAEGTPTSTVFYTAAATDVQGGAVSFTLSGADAAAFTVNTSTGEVTFNASPDYETKSSYSFNVVASDGTISSSQGVTVTVTDVAPSITSATSVSVPEGTATSTVVYTAAANDPAGGAVSFTLSGADAAAFTINAASGQVTFNASPDYETKSSYSFNVVASDGTLTSSQAVTVSVTDVAPAITSATSVSVPEGTATSTVVYTAAATDVQGGAVSFTLSGADAAAFTINAATGAVTFNASPDFETKSSYSFNVVASDGTLTSSQAVTVSVTDVAPTITSATTVSVAEGTATSTVIYTAAANDPAGGAVSFSLSGADAAAFTINAATGAVTFNASPDYETKSAYSFNVVASDGTISSSQAVTVSVTDVAPTITSSSSVSVAEGTATSTVIYTAAANDPAGGAVSFTLSGADAAAFTINAASGQVTFNASPDYETKSSYSFNVVASDGTISSSQAVTVSVTDVAPTITSATSVSVAEGTATSTVIYTAAATDVQGGAVSFTLSGADAAAFTVNAASGQVTFNSSPDYETKTSYTFNVVASDGTTSSSQAVTVSITDANEAPWVTSAATGSFTENTTGTVYTATGSDVDAGDTVVWTLSGTDAALFAVNPATGAVTVLAPHSVAVPGDANADGIYDITLTATDSGGLATARAVQLTLSPASTPSVPGVTLPSTAAQGSGVAPISAPAFADPSPAVPPSAAPVQPAGAPASDPSLGLVVLGQPVDQTVQRSNLASTGAPAPVADRALNLPDLNALPPTAAGQVDLVGFPVQRITLAEALQVGDVGSGFLIGGHRLFVYHGIPDMQLMSDGSGSVRIPQDAFAHTDPSAVVQLEARYLNGLPLPSWLKFEGASGTFRGVPPGGLRGALELEVIARDTDGREAHTRFRLELADLQAESADGRPADLPDLLLGLDVDAKEREKARLQAERQAAEGKQAGKPKPGMDPRAGKQPAASFTDQLRTAKAPKDPLLDRITGSGSTPPRDRR